MKTQSTFSISGSVLVVGQTQTFASGFRKRQIVIETSAKPDQWSRPVAVTLTKDNVSLADYLAVGKEVQVEGFVDGREWTKEGQPTRYFVDLVVRSIMTVTAGGDTHPIVQRSPEPAPAAPAQSATSDDLDMPF